MGCTPSVLLEHIHRDSAANHEKNTSNKKSRLPPPPVTTTAPPPLSHHQQLCKDSANRTVIHRQSLPLTPEEEPLDLNMCSKGKCCLSFCGGDKDKETSSTALAAAIAAGDATPEAPETRSQLEIPKSFIDIHRKEQMGDNKARATKDATTATDKQIVRPKKRRQKSLDPQVPSGSGRHLVDTQPVKEERPEGRTSRQEESVDGGSHRSSKERDLLPSLTPSRRSSFKDTTLPHSRKNVTLVSKGSAVALGERQSKATIDLANTSSGSVAITLPNVYKDSSIKPPSESKKNRKHHHQKGPQDIKYGYLLPPTKVSRLLIAFSQIDQVAETLTRAAEKLGFEVSYVNSEDSALEEFQSKSHELVIIDARSPRALDYDTLCRSIRNTRGNQHAAVVAVVKKSLYEKDEVAIMGLLDSGFNRCIIETTNLIHSVNEIIQIRHSDIRPQSQHATCQALYAALDKCKDLVIITDDGYRCQYMNRNAEKFLGVRPEEVLGKTLHEQLAYESIQVNTMGSSLLRGREWSGPLTLRKKNQEAALTSCKAMPISAAGRMPTHFVLVLDASNTLEAVLAQSRGSVHSIRRGSIDVKSVNSDFFRRSSLAKLNSLPLEAPITKILGLIDQVRETSLSNVQVVQLLDKLEEVLRSPELYSPQVKEDYKVKADDAVVSDLITALLSKAPQPVLSASSRRSSNDSSIYRQSKTTGQMIKVPQALRELLDTCLTWEFDIFRLEDLTKKRPLQHLGMALFSHFEVAASLNCDEKVLQNWLIIIEANYHADNWYHNSTHAADVMQATGGFLEREKIKSIMDPLDEATSLIAAAAHDVDHPGKSSAFLSNSDNPLAILYNDITILESHHAALMFKLTLGDDRVNIFKNLDKETYKLARHNAIDMILATEMTKHFEHLAKFVNVFCNKATSGDVDAEVDFPILTLPENSTLIKRMMIKCSDVSNPTRPLRLCVEWARRIAEEYYQQTDEEKERGLPVVMPMFDRHTCSIPKSQIGFVDYIINDMFEAWNAFIDMPELITYMRQNYIRWKEFDEQGLITLADISRLQSSVLMAPMFPLKTGTKTD